MDSNFSAELQTRLAELQEIFHQQLPGKIDELQTIWQELRDNWTKESLSQLHHRCHSLAGNAGTFGAHEISQQARTLEQHLKRLATEAMETGEAATTTRQQLGQQINTLGQYAEKWRLTYRPPMTAERIEGKNVD